MPTVTLTFDNGPDAQATPEVLDTLARHEISATFFVVGMKLAFPPSASLLQRAQAEGHWIGNHTWSHGTPLGQLPGDEGVTEVCRTHEALGRIGLTPRLFRPFGRAGRIGPHLLSPAVVAWLGEHRYTCVLWNCVPGDWREPEGWVAQALQDLAMREHSVVVLHDLPTGAMRHLDEFIARARDAGCVFSQQVPDDCLPLVAGTARPWLEELVSPARG